MRETARRAWLPWTIASLAACAITFVICESRGLWPRPDVVEAAAAPPLPTLAQASGDQDHSLQRREAELPQTQALADLTFAEYVEQLVQIALRTLRGLAAEDVGAAEDSDGEAHEVFDAMVRHVADADEQALFALLGQGDTAGEEDSIREQVYLFAIEYGLQHRHEEFERAHDRSKLDHLVSGVLDGALQDERFADELAMKHLVDRPFLGLAHEPAVLHLAELAADHQFPEAVATRLMVTLWRNLKGEGQRSSEELTALALLSLDDANPAKSTAACRQLLLDDRFRHVILERARTSKDDQLARLLGLLAAQELPPDTAMSVLTELSKVSHQLMPAFLLLGQRDQGLLRATYELRLADNLNPELRADLVTGAGFSRTPEGLGVAQLAFANDPSQDVRLRAMFVLTANAAEGLGESTLTTALEDERIRSDPRSLGSVVLALENLERAGLVNAVDRLGQRLRTCALAPGDRKNLERILARALPGGQTSR